MSPMSRNGLMLLVLVLIGINMRPLLTSIGPLLPQLQQASGMGFTLVSLLTAIPVIAMGLPGAGKSVDSAPCQRKSRDGTEPDDDRLRRRAS